MADNLQLFLYSLPVILCSCALYVCARFEHRNRRKIISLALDVISMIPQTDALNALNIALPSSVLRPPFSRVPFKSDLMLGVRRIQTQVVPINPRGRFPSSMHERFGMEGIYHRRTKHRPNVLANKRIRVSRNFFQLGMDSRTFRMEEHACESKLRTTASNGYASIKIH
ncbi:hypothetical protein ACJRO7_013122 [Eucalyptus globulus]|uniref:Uncharacterized protein n=1 Tax=Eucalyptus globulus TaxID=34317 RepID=A0ABD3LKY3_EUCGL